MVGLAPNLLLTLLGGVIGIAGALLTAVYQSRVAKRQQRLNLASRFLRHAQMSGAQIIREARRADELDLPVAPGWDLLLIAEQEEIALCLGEGAAKASEQVIDALREMFTGTVGSIQRFEQSITEFRKIYWQVAGRPSKAKAPVSEDEPEVSSDPNSGMGV